MNWADVEQAIRTLRPELSAGELKTVGVLCAAYKTGANQDRITELTGYPLELVHDVLLEFRGKMLIIGKNVSERDILRVLPGAQSLLKGLLFDKIPAIQPVEPKTPTNPISEVTPMEIELCDCGRPARHRGRCQNKGDSKTKPQTAKPTATAPAPAKPTVTVSGVSFSILCEADGQKYEATGSSLEKFNAAMNVVERMMEA